MLGRHAPVKATEGAKVQGDLAVLWPHGYPVEARGGASADRSSPKRYPQARTAAGALVTGIPGIRQHCGKPGSST